LKSVEKSRPQFEHSDGHVTSSHTVATGENKSTLPENWVGGSAAVQQATATQPRRAADAYTGTKSDWYE